LIPFLGFVLKLKLRKPNNYILLNFTKCERGHMHLQIIHRYDSLFMKDTTQAKSPRLMKI
jgi:hypothetical protein